MTKILIDEAVVKQALEALKKYHYYTLDAGLPNQSMLNEGFTAYKALEASLAEQPAQQEPDHMEDALTMVEPPTKEEIRQAFDAHDARFSLVSSIWSFEAGIEFAEKHYGITKGKP